MIARGAVMGAAHGWERPNWFSDTPGAEAEESFRRANWFEPVARECAVTSTKAALADLSVFSKFEVTGPETQGFLDTLGANRPPRVGRIGLTHVLTPAGGVASEFTVARLGDNQAYLTSAAAAEEMDFDALIAHAADYEVDVVNRTEQIAVIGLMGPAAKDILASLTSQTLGPWLSVQPLIIAGLSIRALRVSYVGELGWELHVARDNAVALFTALEQAGKPFGLGYYGAYAANAMRLEKGYRGWGADLTTERTPLESGLDYLVRSAGRKFTGRDAMLARQTDIAWDMVLLEIEPGEVDPFYAHPVLQGGREVGVVTSGAYGHRTGKVLALAYLRDRTARDGLSISILGQPRAARILSRPPYDPGNEKLKR